MLKRLARTRWFIVTALIVLIGTPSAWLMARGPGPTEDSVIATVKKGDFRVLVTTSGELRAPKFVQISVPQNAQQADQWQMKISTLVPEGTMVKEGEVVAELDRSTIASKAADVTLALTKAQAQYEQASLDSTLNLSKAREEIRTMDLTLEEKKLAKEQSKYEAPSVQRQTEIDYEKAERALAQAKIDYKTKTEQAMAKMREVGSDFERQKNKLKVVQEVMEAFTIKAPSPGMVIYVKEWNGKKRAVGSQVNSWDPAVATLPDLTQMESVTFVNEIDVRKLATGQPVLLTLDADPSKKLKGTVTSVANVGEKRPNSDAKVFEVKVRVESPDTTLRPGMTTANAIETFTVANVLHVPLEAVRSDSGVAYVLRRSGSRLIKQEVETGALNDEEVVIARGLRESDRVLLSAPADKDKLELVRLTGSKTPPNVTGGDTATTRTQKVPVKPEPPVKPPKGPAPVPVKKG